MSTEITLTLTGNAASGSFAVSGSCSISPGFPPTNIPIDEIGAQEEGAPFTVSGSYAGYPGLRYSDDQGSLGFLVSGTTAVEFSFTHPGIASGSHVVSVVDILSGASGVSNTFDVAAVPRTITPSVPSAMGPGQPFSFTGVLSGYTTQPVLTLTEDGVNTGDMNSDDITVSGWTVPQTAPAEGDHTWTVSDGTVSGAATFHVNYQSMAPDQPTGVVAGVQFNWTGRFYGYQSQPSGMDISVDGGALQQLGEGYTQTGWSIPFTFDAGDHSLALNDTDGVTCFVSFTVSPA